MKFALACLVCVFAISIYPQSEAAFSDLILDKARALICKGYVHEKSCAIGWVPYKGHCYFFSTDKVSWDDAENSCRYKNAHLAKVEDYDENRWILANTKPSSNALKGGSFGGNVQFKLNYWYIEDRHILWIGGNDKAIEGLWRWTADQSFMTFKHWDFDYNEPNGGSKENCLNLMWQNSDGRWNDNICTDRLLYVCEMN